MPTKKKAVVQSEPKSEKNPKIKNNPESYIRMPVSWQFSLMDFNFEYGWGKVIDRIEFSHDIKQNLLIALAETEGMYR